MGTSKKQFKTIDEYIKIFPKDVQNILEKIRRTIKEVVPQAEETVSYQIPTFNLNDKYLIYFAGWKNHIAIYPLPLGDEQFRKEIAAYEKGKGTIKFPLDKPIPYDLVKKIALFSVKEVEENKNN